MAFFRVAVKISTPLRISPSAGWQKDMRTSYSPRQSVENAVPGTNTTPLSMPSMHRS